MTNLHHVKFSDLVKRHGIQPALELVRKMEIMARIQSAITPLDQEARFRNAVAALSNTQFASWDYYAADDKPYTD